MAKNTSVTLGDHFDKFINQQLNSGRYGSPLCQDSCRL